MPQHQQDHHASLYLPLGVYQLTGCCKLRRCTYPSQPDSHHGHSSDCQSKWCIGAWTRLGSVSQAKLGRTEAEKVARAALAAATAVMQAKRVEILVPPQAAAWLQVCLLSCRLSCLSSLI